MQIDIISDVVCPWCLVGKRHLEAALAQRPDLDVTIRWKPFQLNPDMPKEGMDRKTAIARKFGSAENAGKIYQRVSEAGKKAGVDFNFDAIPKTPNTVDAHRLIHWAGEAGVQDAVVEILFRKFFIDALDVGERDVLADAAAEAGMARDDVLARLNSDLDLEQMRADEQHARALGVSGVPFFVFENKYALSGAQPPEVFLEVFATVEKEAVAAAD